MVDLTHNNSHRSKKKFFWSDFDNEENYNKNIQNPTKQKYFLDNRWYNKESVIYQYNSLGFRCEEFDYRESYIAVGCSFTEGIGLREDQTWSHCLGLLLGSHVWNLGVRGQGISSCYRLLSGYIDLLNVKGVFVLCPPPDRPEYFVNTDWRVAIPQTPNSILGYKEWISSENNTELEEQKSLHAMKYICLSRKINFVSLPSIGSELTLSIDVARDVSPDCQFENENVGTSLFPWIGHPGPKTNKKIADEFYKKFINQYNY